MDDFKVIEVRPSDQKDDFKEQRIDLADHDLRIVPCFIIVACFYALEPQLDKDKLLSGLRKGLEHTLSLFPPFAGKLYNDPETKRICIRRRKQGTFSLGVRYLDGKDSSFPSLGQWSKAGFPDDELHARRDIVFPPESAPSDLPLGVRTEDGCPLCCAQVNFIQGGMILVGAFHHYQGDAASIDQFFGCWAKSSKAISEGKTSLPMPHPSLDRTYFMAKDIPEENGIAALKAKQTAYRFDDIVKEPATRDSGKDVAITTPPPAMPEMTNFTYYFSPENCARLKKRCYPHESGKYVSTYDSLVGAGWCAVTRSRLPYHPGWDPKTRTTKLLNPVDLRQRFDIVPKSYIGNGGAIAVTEPVTVAELLDPVDGPRAAAITVRNAILSVQESTVPDALRLGVALEGKQTMSFAVDAYLGPDFMASSWMSTKCFETYDFGFGLPIGMRAVWPPLDGMLVIFPAREGGFELVMRMEKSCQERILKDREFMEYCEPRSKPLI